MAFQIEALPKENFAHLFLMNEHELHSIGAKRIKVTSNPGFPCRISLEDAQIGETVILTNFEHQPENTPYKASHAIYLREHIETATPGPDEVPLVLRSRLISLRGFNSQHSMIAADVADGELLGQNITSMLLDSEIAYIHLHNAKPGCYAAKVTRI